MCWVETQVSRSSYGADVGISWTTHGVVDGEVCVCDGRAEVLLQLGCVVAVGDEVYSC